MACSGLASMPDVLDVAAATAVAEAAKATGVEITAVSGTYNMIHPDIAVRDKGHALLNVLASRCADMGSNLVTLCTGTRDAADQWREHPENNTPEAWRDLLGAMETAIAIAEHYNIDLGIEPELANVVNSAQKARQLIDQLQSPRLKIVLDPANLFEVVSLEEQRRIVSASIDLLADRIVMGHAKDRALDGSFTTAGKGVLDYAHYLKSMKSIGFDGTLITHGLAADEADPMTEAFAAPDGTVLNIESAGDTGVPVIFQHGLCGDARQTAEVFPPDSRFRRMTIEARGHGASAAGDLSQLSIATFADDIIAYIDANHLAPVVVGGISMGAAIALRLAVHRPDLVRGLILARPAWVLDAAPDNMKPNAEVGALLATLSQAEARKKFMTSATADDLAAHAPDNLASLQGFFSREPQAVTAALLQAISADGPDVSESEVRALTVPTLVIGHERDSVHPLSHAKLLAAMISGARFVEIAPKAEDKTRRVFKMTHLAANWVETLPSNRLIAEFSVWSSDLARLADEMARIEPHADVLHIDVADGHFAPAMLFFPDLVTAVRKVSTKPIHVHLMVADSILLSQIEQFCDAGADLISIHVENDTVAGQALDLLDARGVAAGMVLKVETPVERVAPYVPRLRFLTLLGTAIGVKGQGLNEAAFARLDAAEKLIEASGAAHRIVLAADGGIRENTVPLLRQAGAQTVVLGSLAFNAPDLAARMNWLHGL
eukprot:gene14082-14201_t